jgi:membrane-anchored glycerophosphoryl diester phosphodiesterase (GDPDase)
MKAMEDTVESDTFAKRRSWQWTKRLSVLFATVLAIIQLLIGLYAQITLPPPPVGFASFGVAIMQGSVITAVLFAFVGAILGSFIDLATHEQRCRQRSTMSTLQ